jgi:hypothetical protein
MFSTPSSILGTLWIGCKGLCLLLEFNDHVLVLCMKYMWSTLLGHLAPPQSVRAEKTVFESMLDTTSRRLCSKQSCIGFEYRKASFRSNGPTTLTFGLVSTRLRVLYTRGHAAKSMVHVVQQLNPLLANRSCTEMWEFWVGVCVRAPCTGSVAIRSLRRTERYLWRTKLTKDGMHQ